MDKEVQDAQVEKSTLEVVNETPQERTIPETLTVSQAVGVLVQATDMGRQKGIFSWEDLELIAKAMKTIQEPAKK